MSPSEEVFPVYHRMLDRGDKERLLRQRGCVLWFYGMSGSGKSTLAINLEKRLHGEGVFTQVLDGDNIRTGLSSDLGFSESDRLENVRRIAEVARLFKESGVVTLVSFITPLETARELARSIVGGEDLTMIYVKASFEACSDRDPKGLYARGASGELSEFTKEGMIFEEPADPDLVIETETEPVETSLDRIYEVWSRRFVRSSEKNDS